jgi:hypothetical protein
MVISNIKTIIEKIQFKMEKRKGIIVFSRVEFELSILFE